MGSKKGVLIIVQVDHLNGELLGSVIDTIYEAGASNVNIVSSVTKKNRPGYMVFIDVLPAYMEAVETAAVRELNVSGWHRVTTEHCYLPVDYKKREYEILANDISFQLTVEAKVINGDTSGIRPENRSCVMLKKKLEEAGVIISLGRAYQLLYESLVNESDTIQVETK